MARPNSGTPSWIWDHWKEWNQVREAELKRRSSFKEMHRLQPPIVGGQAHLDRLRDLASAGHWDEIDEILARQAQNVFKYWLSILKKKPKKKGRPPTTAELYTEAAHLKDKGLSWGKVALHLDPKGYQADRHLCIDRFRKGVKSYKQAQRKIAQQ